MILSSQIWIAYARSYSTCSMKSPELTQVIGNSCENHLDVDSLDRGNKHMRSLEDGLYYVSTASKLSLTQSAIPKKAARQVLLSC